VASEKDWLEDDGYFELVTISGKTMNFSGRYSLKKIK
jgi:hypothetical protein